MNETELTSLLQSDDTVTLFWTRDGDDKIASTPCRMVSASTGYADRRPGCEVGSCAGGGRVVSGLTSCRYTCTASCLHTVFVFCRDSAALWPFLAAAHTTCNDLNKSRAGASTIQRQHAPADPPGRPSTSRRGPIARLEWHTYKNTSALHPLQSAALASS